LARRRARGIDVVIADTAGRLPTQLHLMEEIRKVKRVAGKALAGAPHEVLLVLDANTGQNSLAQVRAFDDALGLTGLILTKLDGTRRAAWCAPSRRSGRSRCSSSAWGKTSTTCARSSRKTSPRPWLVSFSAVAKRYPGGQEALKSVTFSVEAGELAFVTGRSGAGKSTLLKLIAAIERPTSGSVIVNGQNVGVLTRAAVPYLRRNIGLVFQDQKLLYDRSVLDNVMLPLAFSGQPPKEAARRARAALDKVGLLAREKANPIQLSGGEQQRLAIARAGRQPARHPDRRRAHREPRRRVGRAHSRRVRRLQPGRRDGPDRHARPGPRRALGQARASARGRAHRLSAWLRQHRQAAAAALRRLGVLNTAVIGVALSLPAGGYALLENLRDVAGRFALDTQISVFLQPGAKRAEADSLGRTLRADRRIAKVRFVPREQALKELSSVQGVAEVIAALGRNPCPTPSW
jgi:ABC-type uncharacterized transport system YnjBCD ATPase subunit